jgi:two-component system response regulator AlgR
MRVAEILSQLSMPPAIIFTTAYKDHALEAFEKQAVDYLLKPIRKARLEMALQRADLFLKNRVKPSTLAQNAQARSHITINVRGELQLIPVKDIYYFSAEEKYVILHWKQGEVLLTDTLKALQQEFAGQFLRIHRSALVATIFIKGLIKDKQGHCYINLRDVDTSLEVSRRHLPNVRKILKDMRLPTI